MSESGVIPIISFLPETVDLCKCDDFLTYKGMRICIPAVCYAYPHAGANIEVDSPLYVARNLPFWRGSGGKALYALAGRLQQNSG